MSDSMNSFDGTLNVYEDEQKVADKLVALHERFLSNEKTTSHHNLTQREEAILIDLYNGLGNQEIANKLCVSIHTIRAHRRTLLSKTKIKCVAQFVDYVRKYKLIEF